MPENKIDARRTLSVQVVSLFKKPLLVNASWEGREEPCKRYDLGNFSAISLFQKTYSQQLQKANSKMLKALWESDKVIIVDGDSSTLRSYPNKKQGAKLL